MVSDKVYICNMCDSLQVVSKEYGLCKHPEPTRDFVGPQALRVIELFNSRHIAKGGWNPDQIVQMMEIRNVVLNEINRLSS